MLLLTASVVLMPVNNLFRQHIESLKTGYWKSLEQLTGYYLESVRGLTTLKLFDRDEDRTLGLEERSRDFNARIMDVMKVNFASFLVTDGLIYGSMTAAVCLTAWQLTQGQVTFGQSLMFLMLSFGFFGSVRQLMTSTHCSAGRSIGR